MSLHDNNPAFDDFVQPDPSQCMTKTIADTLGRLPPMVQLRLLAFLHLVDSPDALKAALDVQPSCSVRLTLDALVAPCRLHQH
jgi:hypothetical protein